MSAAGALLEQLQDTRPADVAEAGQLLLAALSGGRLAAEAFLDDPQLLSAPPYLAPRYLSQVTWRALQNGYDTVEELAASLQAFLDRNPPVLEDRKSTRLNSSHVSESRMPSSA